jgi:Asp-tRNA(Asn)/Glu-tRNA(Gln) amidotransferase A subunit family amidase
VFSTNAYAYWFIHSLTEILFKDALAQARELDAYYAKEGKTKGPFHGIPISLKDQFNVKGHDTTLGYTARSFNPASEDAVLVNILKKLGAVMICKTNIPQSIMVSASFHTVLLEANVISGLRLTTLFGA